MAGMVGQGWTAFGQPLTYTVVFKRSCAQGVTMPKDSEQRVTSEEFITATPLYTRVVADHFEPPMRISYVCAGKCKKETTWAKLYTEEPLTERHTPVKSVGYQCSLCSESALFVIYRGSQTKNVNGGWTWHLMKIGQLPMLTAEIPKGLQECIGENASALYRKALVCRNNGYGLGAAVYFRRVVEDKTNELIEVAASLAESYDVAPEIVAKMRGAGDSEVYTPYEEKLRVASTVFPENLKVNGINPLGVLYELVSKAVHGLSEEQCIDIADETAEAFSFIFTNLRANVAERRSFIEKVQKWATPRKNERAAQSS